MALGCSRCTTILLLLLFSAIPLSIIVALERTKSATRVYEYNSSGWFRECAKWDDQGRRFLVSRMEGGVSQVVLPDGPFAGAALEEQVVVVDGYVAGNGSLGIRVDRPRNRVLVVHSDVAGNRYGALAAYDLLTWERRFLTQLSGPGDEKALADDVAVDDDGNAYVTDAISNKIWKVGLTGEILSTIRSPIFQQRKEWYYNWVGLNGIVYHPNGFLLVVHTASGHLFKVDVGREEISTVEIVGGSLITGDGLELLSPTRIVVAGIPSARLVESLDGWETAKVVGRYVGPMHRWASSATVKDGKVYLNHLFGGGLPKRKHVIVEASFSPLN